MTLERNVKIVSEKLASDMGIAVGTVVKALKASDCWTDGETWYDEDGTPMAWAIHDVEEEDWWVATDSDVEEVE